MGIEFATIAIVASLLALMAIGIPLGITTLVVSIGTALLYFGPPGLTLIAANVLHVLEKYELIAVPFFVFMANMLERSGVANPFSRACRCWGDAFAVPLPCRPVLSPSFLLP